MSKGDTKSPIHVVGKALNFDIVPRLEAPASFDHHIVDLQRGEPITLSGFYPQAISPEQARLDAAVASGEVLPMTFAIGDVEYRGEYTVTKAGEEYKLDPVLPMRREGTR